MVSFVFGVGDADFFGLRVGKGATGSRDKIPGHNVDGTGASNTGGSNTVKGVTTHEDTVNNVLGFADTKEVAGFILGENFVYYPQTVT